MGEKGGRGEGESWAVQKARLAQHGARKPATQAAQQSRQGCMTNQEGRRVHSAPKLGVARGG